MAHGTLYPSVQGDHANTFPGGLGQEVLGDKLEIQTFTDMKHGWTVRGGQNRTSHLLLIIMPWFFLKFQICLTQLFPEMWRRQFRILWNFSRSICKTYITIHNTYTIKRNLVLKWIFFFCNILYLYNWQIGWGNTRCGIWVPKGRATNRSILQFCLSFRHQWVYLSSVKSSEAIKCGGIQW